MKISVITINYNSSDYTLKFAQSLKEYTSKEIEYELIIVDNASSIEEINKLKPLEGIANIKIIYNRLNTGFAAGNMTGVQHSSADYYYFLNNDMELQNDILSILYNYALKNKECAMLTTQLLNADQSRASSFHKFPTLANKLFGNSIERLFIKNDFPSNKAIITEPTDVGVASGSSMFVDAAVFDKLGGLDTIFFLYCEEEDISKRIWDAGYKVRFLPDAKLIHYSGGSSDKRAIMEKEFYISYFMLLDKHFGYFSSKVLKVLTIFKLFRRIFRANYYFNLFLFVLRGAPVKESLRYKQSIQKKQELL